MIVKIIITLVILVAIGTIGFTLLGEGVFETVPESQAQAIIEEAIQVEEAMEIYALENDGVVDIGDPSICPDGVGSVAAGDCAQGQTTLHFVKEANLLKDWAGLSFDLAVDPWLINENQQSVERIVETEEVCQLINHIRGGQAPGDEVFACDTPEGQAQYCCFSNS